MSRKVKRKRLKKKPIIVLLILIILIGGGVFGYKKYFTKEETKKVVKKEKPKKVAKDYQFNLVMVGDALIHYGLYADAKTGNNSYDFKPMFTNLKPIISKYDLAYYNQETILGGKRWV